MVKDKVRCRYCSELSPWNAKYCINCSRPLVYEQEYRVKERSSPFEIDLDAPFRTKQEERARIYGEKLVQPYDVREQQQSGTVITGLSGSGKSNWAKHLADLMMAEGLRVYVFDPSQEWHRSNLPKLSVLEERKIPVKNSTVYDISLLHEENQKAVVSWFAKLLFESAVKGDYNLPTVLVLEEAQLYMTNSFFRSKAGSELKRYITVGRNYDLHFMLISRRLANLSTDAVMTCGQRYHGYTDELHDWNRAKNYLHEWSKQLGSLDVGEFIYKKRNSIRRIKTPLHYQTRIPQALSWWEKVTSSPLNF